MIWVGYLTDDGVLVTEELSDPLDPYGDIVATLIEDAFNGAFVSLAMRED